MRQYFLFYPDMTTQTRGMTKRQKEGPIVMDFFAGCGGLSLGLEFAGFTPFFVNELNRDAMQTYLRNRPQFPHLQDLCVDDVKKLVRNDGVELKSMLATVKRELRAQGRSSDIDAVVGGPPCQGFSGIGHRRSYAVDKRQLPSNHLYQDYAYVIAQIRPKLFLFENVRGLLSSRWTPAGSKGEIWHDVRQTFAEIPGYRVGWAEVRARDYGVAQNRPRVLLVGVREDIKWEPSASGDGVETGFLPEPEGVAPHLFELLGDLVDRKYRNGLRRTEVYPNEATKPIQKWFRRVHPSHRMLRKGEPLTEHEYSNHDERIVAKFEHMLANKGEIPAHFATKKFAQRLLPRRWKEEGPTITATSLPDDYVHYAQPRTLTVREWARLQFFPDWYEFSGKRTTGGLRRAGNPVAGVFDREVPKYTQIGNAVPVLLAKAVGAHFRRILERG